MASKIGEVNQLFILASNDPAELSEEDILRTRGVKVADLIEFIPERWRSIGEVTDLEVIFAEPYFREEIYSQHQLFQMVKGCLSGFFHSVRKEVALRLWEIKTKVTRSSQPHPKIYTQLAKYSQGFAARKKVKDSSEKEIETATRIILAKTPIDQLLVEGEELCKKNATPEELYNNAVEHIQKLSEVLEADGDRVVAQENHLRQIFTEYEGACKKLKATCPQKVHLLESRAESFREFEKISLEPSKELKKKNEKVQKIVERWRKKHLPDYKRIEQVAQNTINRLANTEIIKPAGSLLKLVKWTKFIGFLPKAFGLIGALYTLRFNAASMRHKMLMKGMRKLEKDIATLFKGMRILHHQLNELDRKLVKISENQEIIDKKITAVLNNIQILYHDTQLSLAKLTHKVSLSNRTLDALIDEGGKSARAARMKLLRFPGYSSYFNRFLTYDALQAYYNEERFHLQKALDKLPTLLMQPESNNAAVTAGTFSEDDSFSYFAHYQEILQFYLSATQEWSVQQQFAYLLTDVDSLSMLKRHQKKLPKDEKLPDWMQLFSVNIVPYVNEPYNFSLLLDYIESACSFHYFYSLIDGLPGEALLSIEQLEQETQRNEGEQLLKDSFIRLEIALFQANLFAGSGMIPFLFQALAEDVKKAKKDKLKKAEYSVNRMIAPNRLLAQNLIIYAIHQILKKNHTLNEYELAYHSAKDPILLTQILGDFWAFEWNEQSKNWGVRLSDEHVPVPLPHPKKVMNGELEPHPRIAELQFQRNQVMRELAGYHTEAMGKKYRNGLQLTAKTFREIMTIPMEGSNVTSIKSRL